MQVTIECTTERVLEVAYAVTRHRENVRGLAYWSESVAKCAEDPGRKYLPGIDLYAERAERMAAKFAARAEETAAALRGLGLDPDALAADMR